MHLVSNGEIYLSDEQYRKILWKIKDVVDTPRFSPTCFDSTALGDKYTESNCGLCNDGFTDEETALFPSKFPERREMKYRLGNHRCPFDMREIPGLLGWGNGCFSGCYLFKNTRVGYDVELMKMLVDSAIIGVELGN
jgi:hypothetical protein